MSESLERLHRSVVAACALDPARSRASHLLQCGVQKMAKKLAEEAGPDAVHDGRRKSARKSYCAAEKRTALT